MKRYAIIVAGGSGTRFGAPVPKQFAPLEGRPVLMRTIDQFHQAGNVEILLVLPASQQRYWHELCRQHNFDTPHTVVQGGDSRFQSVKNALAVMHPEPGDLVAVHDGVRPLVSVELIGKIYQAAASSGAAVPVTPVTDSVRQLDGRGSSQALPRASLRAVQTPQAFDALQLKRDYDVPCDPFFTDDASVWERAGGQVTLVEGEITNIKITHPVDIVVAQHLLHSHD